MTEEQLAETTRERSKRANKRRDEFLALIKEQRGPQRSIGTRFPAWLSPTGVKFTRLGDTEIKLIIPYKYREQVLGLVVNETMLLDVDIEAWDREKNGDVNGEGNGSGNGDNGAS